MHCDMRWFEGGWDHVGLDMMFGRVGLGMC